MSSQIIFETDPLNNSYFAFGGQVQSITMNVSQWMQMREEIFHMTLFYMQIALIAGLIMGIVIGWSWKEYYLKKERESNGGKPE